MQSTCKLHCWISGMNKLLIVKVNDLWKIVVPAERFTLLRKFCHKRGYRTYSDVVFGWVAWILLSSLGFLLSSLTFRENLPGVVVGLRPPRIPQQIFKRSRKMRTPGKFSSDRGKCGLGRKKCLGFGGILLDIPLKNTVYTLHIYEKKCPGKFLVGLKI